MEIVSHRVLIEEPGQRLQPNHIKLVESKEQENIRIAQDATRGKEKTMTVWTYDSTLMDLAMRVEA